MEPDLVQAVSANREKGRTEAMSAKERIETIRATVNAKKTEASDLQHRIKDPTLKDMVKLAEFWLDDVETGMWRSAETEERTPVRLAAWLDATEDFLKLPVAKLRYAQDLVAKYGDNLVMLDIG